MIGLPPGLLGTPVRLTSIQKAQRKDDARHIRIGDSRKKP